jgi:hypothetical protein
MEEEMKFYPSSLKWSFFFIGFLATVAYRIIIILNFYSPLWVKIAWYIGTVGFILYFGYLYIVQTRRVKLIEKYKLVEVVKRSGIRGKNKKALQYLVHSNATSKARWNSVLIFILSVVALLIGIFLDFS